jgi:hypothetical protein
VKRTPPSGCSSAAGWWPALASLIRRPLTNPATAITNMPLFWADSAWLSLRRVSPGSFSQTLSTRNPLRTMALTDAASSPLPAAPPSANPHPSPTGKTS